MSVLSPSGLETVTYSQQGWNAIVNANFEKINDAWSGIGGGYWDRDTLYKQLYPSTATDGLRLPDDVAYAMGSDGTTGSAGIFARSGQDVIEHYTSSYKRYGWYFVIDDALSPGYDYSGLLMVADTNSLVQPTGIVLGWRGTKTDVPADTIIGHVGLAHAGYEWSSYEAGPSEVWTRGKSIGAWGANDYESRFEVGVNAGEASTHVILRADFANGLVIGGRDIAFDYDIDDIYCRVQAHTYIGARIQSAASVEAVGLVGIDKDDAGCAGIGHSEMPADDVDSIGNFMNGYSIASNSAILMMVVTDDTTYGAYGLVYFRPGTTSILSNGGGLSATKNTANKLNIYSEASVLKIQNKLGTTTHVSLWVLGTDNGH